MAGGRRPPQTHVQRTGLCAHGNGTRAPKGHGRLQAFRTPLLPDTAKNKDQWAKSTVPDAALGSEQCVE